MRTYLLLLPGLVYARLDARQASTTSIVTDPATPTAGGPSTVSGSPSGVPSASTASPPPPTEPITLLTQNPTAVPLSQILSSVTPHPTIPLPTVYPPGSSPTGIPGAPPIPNYAALLPSNYPPLDKVPPTDSPEVQAWIQQVRNSGIPIPDFNPTLPGGCETNPGLVGNATRCWWTCGQCVRQTDVTVCPDKLTWGVSFDDGPSPYTPNLLSYLDSVNIKSTFFIVGSRAISRPDILVAEYMQGHQLSVHTWSHTSLTTQSTEQIIAELGWTAKIIRDITGVTPNTMRPPYGDIDDRVRAISHAMGLTPIIWTSHGDGNYDTNDWHIAGGTVSASGVINAFERILTDAATLDTGFIVLAHDLYQQTVDLATGYVLPDALVRKPAFKMLPIVSCLHMPLENAYIETNHNDTNPPPKGTGVGAPTPTKGSQAGAASRLLPQDIGSLRFVGATMIFGAIGSIMLVL